jgi:hypothetical protein
MQDFLYLNFSLSLFKLRSSQAQCTLYVRRVRGVTIPVNGDISEYGERSVCSRCEKLNFLKYWESRWSQAKLRVLRESEKKNFAYCASQERSSQCIHTL